MATTYIAGLFALWCIVWWVLSGGETASWLLGLPSAILATWVSLKLSSPGPTQKPAARIKLRRVPAFGLYFLWESFRGGLDVARRSLHAQPDLSPGFVEYHPEIPEGPARLFFINCISLMPGTLAARLEDGHILIHTLSTSSDNKGVLKQLEDRIAHLFGTSPEASA